MHAIAMAAVGRSRVPNTVPREVKPELLDFCSSISSEQPRFVPSRPTFGAKPGFCFDNVQRHRSRKGGEVACGWAIWHFRGAYFEAEHHGVWCSPAGALMDVSPQLNGSRQILFLPDPSAPYDPLQFRSNILRAESGSALGEEIVAVASRRNQILDTYREGGAREALVSDEDQAQLTVLQQQLQALLRNFT